MALLWMDGFDHYGTGADGRLAMLDGVWAEVNSSSAAISSTHARTGTYALRDAGSTSSALLRRIFGAAKATVGVGLATWLDSLPASNDNYGLIVFCDTGNIPQVAIVVQSTGKISAYRCNGTNTTVSALLAESSDGAIVSGAFQHVEAMATIHNSAGAVEVRVNGVTVLSASGVDTQATVNAESSQVRINAGIGVGNTNLTGFAYVDDVFAWDTAGAQNADFLGDRRVRTIYPDGNTATADWDANGAANAWDCINDTDPDDTTTYISADPLAGSPPTPLTSIFTLESLPGGVGAIAGIQTYVRMKKSAAGDANVQVSLISGGDESAGADNAITEAFTYWMDVHELNPDTGTPWSEATIAAAQIQVKRTA